MPFVTSSEAAIHYQFHSTPQRPVLLLSNSLGIDLSMWSYQAAKFAEHFSLLRYDTRGHGQSSVTAGPYSIEQLGLDVLALLDALELKQVHFCGLSMGGMIGQWVGSHAPERLHSLVLADTAAQSGDAGFWNQRINTAIQNGMDAVIPEILGGWFTEDFRANRPDEVERIAALLRATKPEGFAACCAAIRDMDQQGDAARVSVPTLVAYGEHDVATPAVCSRFLLEQISKSEELVLSAGHISNVEDADGFTNGVLGFLLRQDPR
jgi:3-oxoadipate enol-lactonase